MKKIDFTRHGLERYNQRIGELPKKHSRKKALKAYRNGKRFADFSPDDKAKFLRSFKKNPLRGFSTGRITKYEGSFFVFSTGGKCITCYRAS